MSCKLSRVLGKYQEIQKNHPLEEDESQLRHKVIAG